MKEVYLGDLRPDLYSEMIYWCRDTFDARTIKDKWNIDFDQHTLTMCDEFYALFVLRWS